MNKLKIVAISVALFGLTQITNASKDPNISKLVEKHRKSEGMSIFGMSKENNKLDGFLFELRLAEENISIKPPEYINKLIEIIAHTLADKSLQSSAGYFYFCKTICQKLQYAQIANQIFAIEEEKKSNNPIDSKLIIMDLKKEYKKIPVKIENLFNKIIKKKKEEEGYCSIQ